MAAATADSIDSKQYDVTILGGGLAGLTLALQCRGEMPDASIVVLEKNQHPVPEAAFKVGESTVEVATHYFTQVLGLEEHMVEDQLPKLGLRFFFRAGDNRSIDRRLELGGHDFPPKPSFQLDRGRFENFLGERCRGLGIEFVDGAKITDVQLGRGRANHHVQYVRDGVESSVTSRWVADTSGRAAILKRMLGLEQEGAHHANAVWFRIPAEIKIDDWSNDTKWGAAYDENTNPRWLSTNHLMGEGYWVWLIPLASGATSIGIVADEKIHPISGFNSREKALQWLEHFEPQCAEKVREHEMQDFLAIKRFALECKQIFSANRWGITGEAGMFLDPFYSPGSDFIGYGNTYLTELIKRDLSGKSIRIQAPFYDYLYNRMHSGTSVVYQGQYHMFGNHQVMPVKILWDYMIYWTLSGYLFCHDRATDSTTGLRHLFKINRLDKLNRCMQKVFRAWHQQIPSWESTGTIDAWDMPVIIETNRSLLDNLDNKAYARRFKENVAQMETIFWEIIDKSGVDCDVPLRRRRHKHAKKGTFDVLFEATARRLEEDPAAAEPAPMAASDLPASDDQPEPVAAKQS